jgi:hypothetical protein
MASRWWALVMLAGAACAWGCAEHGEGAEPAIAIERGTLTAGRNFTCQVQDDGEVLCWGEGYAPVGKLVVDDVPIMDATRVAIGGSIFDKQTPVCVLDARGKVSCSGGVPAIGPAIDVAVGTDHACAVLIDGERIACWEQPENGRPRGAATFYEVAEAIEVAVGNARACALTRRGPVICWGFGRDCPPRWIVGFGMGVDIAAQMDMCAVDRMGVVRCMPPGPACPSEAASRLVRVPGIAGAQRVAAGENNNCAVVDDGVRCWLPVYEDKLEGPLLGEFMEFSSDTKIRQLALGAYHACVEMDDGAVQCWGSNSDHQVDGLNHPFVIDAPRLVSGLENITTVAVAAGQSCARQRNGLIHCWGKTSERSWSGTPRRMDHGEPFHDSSSVLDHDESAKSTMPQALEGVRDIASCDGRAWVLDHAGLVWLARVQPSGVPLEYRLAIELPAAAVSIACVASEACAQLEDDTVACWSESSSPRYRPWVVELSRPSAGMTMGVRTACAWSRDRHVECWGDPEAPSLAFASRRVNAENPAELPGVDDATSVAITHSHGCVVHADGKVSCWGSNVVGEVGTGDGGWRLKPVVVPLTAADR